MLINLNVMKRLKQFLSFPKLMYSFQCQNLNVNGRKVWRLLEQSVCNRGCYFVDAFEVSPV